MNTRLIIIKCTYLIIKINIKWIQIHNNWVENVYKYYMRYEKTKKKKIIIYKFVEVQLPNVNK